MVRLTMPSAWSFRSASVYRLLWLIRLILTGWKAKKLPLLKYAMFWVALPIGCACRLETPEILQLIGWVSAYIIFLNKAGFQKSWGFKRRDLPHLSWVIRWKSLKQLQRLFELVVLRAVNRPLKRRNNRVGELLL